MNELLKLLNPQQQTLWNNYAHAYQNGIKHKAKELLKEFIDSVKQESEDAKKQIALTLYALRETENFNIQHPLFKEILLPVFIEGAKKNEAGFYRMIGEFEQSFFSDKDLGNHSLKELNIESDYFDAEIFFKKELESSPNDLKAARHLAKHIQRNLDFAIHELLPSGLLEDVDFFNSMVKEFEELLKKYHFLNDDFEFYLQLLKVASKTWEKYLAQEEIKPYKDYLHFLNNSDSQIILKWAGKLQTEF